MKLLPLILHKIAFKEVERRTKIDKLKIFWFHASSNEPWNSCFSYMIYWLSDEITMQKLILLGLFLSCFEIQNILGSELLQHLKKVPWGPWDPQPRSPGPPASNIEPTPIPPFQECWDGNKCHWHWQCGKNGKCKDRINSGWNWPSVGYVYLQKFKALFQFFCLN